uniref:G_PROTEIN_RECEP_F1_2 domain-containing protein n=1 Tax=Panagrellus redivivus TaxID=6233 RepID=A0A7E4UMX3_PANRE
MAMSPYYYLGVDILIITLQTLSIIGNGFVISLFIIFKRLRQNMSLRLLLLLCCSDWVFAVLALPYTVYYVVGWNQIMFDYNAIIISLTGSAFILAYKVNLIVTIAIAVDRLQAMRMPVYYRRKSQMCYVWMTLFIGLAWGAADTVSMIIMTPLNVHIYNCAAMGCFQANDFRAYWGISNMFLNVIAMLLTIWVAHELSGFKRKNSVTLGIREQKQLTQVRKDADTSNVDFCFCGH